MPSLLPVPRVPFFGASPAWLMYLLAALALGLLAQGWRRRPPDLRALLLGGPEAWLNGALLICLVGLTASSLWWQLHILFNLMSIPTYLAFCLTTDLLGAVALVVAALLALVRLGSLGSRALGLGVWGALGLLLVLASGFLLEAVRLGTIRPEAAWASPVGWWLAGFTYSVGWDWLFRYLWWLHAGLALGWLALLPWIWRHRC